MLAVMADDCFLASWPDGPNYGNTQETGMDRGSWRNNIYYAKFSVEVRVQHVLVIESAYFQ